MVGVEVVRRLAGVFEVDGVHVHADGKGADGFAQLFGRDGADQAGIQPAGEQEPHRGVGVQPLFHPGGQLFPDAAQDGVHIVLAVGGGVGNVAVAHELPVAVVAADGEGVDLLYQSHQVFGLRREGDGPGGAVAVEQRPDADGVPGGDEQFFAAVVQDHGELGVQVLKHIQPVPVVQGQQDLAVGVRLEGAALGLQLPFEGAEPVQLAVAGHAVLPPEERLHPRFGQAHDGQPPEAQQAELRPADTVVVRPAGGGAQQIFGESFGGQVMPGIAHDTAHVGDAPSISYGHFPRMARKKDSPFAFP